MTTRTWFRHTMEREKKAMRSRIFALSAALLLLALAAGAQEKSTFSIESAKSKLEIHVYKEGAFKMFGHDHLIAAKDISGEARFDPQNIEASSVRLKIPAKSITVVDPGESEKDRNDVQTTMAGEKVLYVAKFPEITFVSTRVSAAKKSGDAWELTLSGKLSLHGQEKPVSFPLQVHAAGTDLHGQGELSILQTDYGITPVKVGGGAVKVKDKLKINFTIVAKKAG
jgi:polyisoprenoid-binding protein YceI